MTGTPLIDRPVPAPPRPEPLPPRRNGDGRVFGIILLVMLFVGTSVVVLATNVARDEVPLAPDVPAGDAGGADQAPAEEPAEEPAGDELNVRRGPGVGYDVVGTLSVTSPELESTGRIADVGSALWREIVVPGDGVGWVNASFLTETR